MKLVVLGATGGTGMEIVRQALGRGHSVTALVRSPNRLKPFGDRITVKQGYLLSSADLQQVIQGHDAVVSGLYGSVLPKAMIWICSSSCESLTRPGRRSSSPVTTVSSATASPKAGCGSHTGN